MRPPGTTRAPLTLAPRRHPAGTSAPADLTQAPPGTWRTAPLAMLPPALACFDCDTHHRAACEAPIARPFAAMTPRWERAARSMAPGQARLDVEAPAPR